ncbi:MAG: alpha/beta hydrolase [Leptospiraceae bacterium]|nr:alpha/beta hydrolase [Leptospiraceae bacterium]MCK6382316.1 alpha/beta hydrolase [Leptospiraceae bacterium]NUM41029.1 alpha/beta hydrolase [Leptospiraceae bacterium]
MKHKSFIFDSHSLSYIDFEGNFEKTILLTHANGYSSECYLYILEELAKDFRVIALDFTGHGKSEPSLNFESWYYFRDEILELINHESLENVIGIGHSLGGASLLLAASKKPSSFSKVIALDPVILDFYRILYVKVFGGPLAKTSKNRRRKFKSIEFVRKAFKKFPAFSKWDNRVFEDYLKSCFRVNGSDIELCCDPEIETKIFNMSNFSTLFKFSKIKTETHLIYPKKYEVCPPNTAKKIIRGNPNSSITVIDEATHFFPFEIPDWTLKKIKSLV